MLSAVEVAKIAHLARLSLGDVEATQHRVALNRILALVEQLQAVDTTGVEPLAHPIALTQRLRADVVTEIDQHTVFQQIAPQVESDLYLVPRVIE
jgi:aspartyl-tRNA(Asn)/glutamyl-tRNA(Gln) amidotransferase subunit C